MRFVFDHQLVSDFAKRFYPFFMRIKRFLSVLSVRYPFCRRFDLAPQTRRAQRGAHEAHAIPLSCQSVFVSAWS